MEYDCADGYGNFYCSNYHKFPRNIISKLRLTCRPPGISAFRSEPRRELNRGSESRTRARIAELSRGGAREEVNSWTSHFRQVFRSSKILRQITLPFVPCAIPDGCRASARVFSSLSRLRATFEKRLDVRDSSAAKALQSGIINFYYQLFQ